MKQTVVVQAGAKNGKPWAAKVLSYEEGMHLRIQPHTGHWLEMPLNGRFT